VPGSPTTSPDVVTIRWERPTSDGGSPITGYLVEHRRTGSPHWVRATLTLVSLNELSLSGLEPGWRYQFRVIAENYLGKSEPSELSDPLTVTLQRTGISPPRFTIDLQDTVALENEKVEFRVHVIGEPPPQVSWFKDGFEVFSSRRTKIITENDSSILIIHQSALTDEGEIKCTATNRAGYAIARANLSIEALPKIRLPRQYEDGLIIEAEEVIRLKVSIAGRPVPVVIWSHNGEIINDNYRYELENTDKYSALKISNSQRSDRGEYNLRAINKLGEDNASFLVTITSRPRPPGKVSIKMSLGKTVTLSWLPPDDDGGCKIGNYIVEYFRIGWNVWLKVATCRQLTTILNDLIEGSEYRFRVKAENPYGLSDPGEESDVLFIPDPKRGILKPKKEEEEDFTETEKPPLLPRKKSTGNNSPSLLSVNDEIKGFTPEKSPDSRARQQKLTFNIKFTPEIFDTNALEREMSYGSPQAFEKFTELPNFDIQTPQDVNKPAEATSKPTVAAVTFKNDLPKSKQLSVHKNNENHEALHSSSEFMLVLYPDKEGKSSNCKYFLRT
jgi:titin